MQPGNGLRPWPPLWQRMHRDAADCNRLNGVQGARARRGIAGEVPASLFFGRTLRREDLRLNLPQQRTDVVRCALALIEQRAQHARETRAHRHNDSAWRVAPEPPADELIQLLDAGYEDGIVRLIDCGHENLFSGCGRQELAWTRWRALLAPQV
jgi:hypothetical protein